MSKSGRGERWPRIREDFLVFGSPQIGREEIAEVVATLESGWLGTGPRVATFESEFAQLKGVPHAVAMNSCTAALHIALLASGVGPGDEVITSPMTFPATANAIVHAGARPVFVDCDDRTMNIQVEALEEKITPRTKAILPIHFAGRPCEMDQLMAIADKHGLAVIEDCAHAIETEYKGRPAGTIGDIGCFSFYVTKNVITGEGGMLITSDSAIAERSKTLSLHGLSGDAWSRFSDSGYKHYYLVDAGFKYNMMDIQAAIGIHQLRRVQRNYLRRQHVWERYMTELNGLPCLLPPSPEPDTTHALHLFTIQLQLEEIELTRDEVLSALTQMGIGVGVHYLALHLHPYYANSLGHEPSDFPAARMISDRTISLPISAKLEDGDIDDVVTALKEVLR